MWEILKAHGIDPSPERTATTWAADQVGVSRETVSKWRRRFLADRLGGMSDVRQLALVSCRRSVGLIGGRPFAWAKRAVTLLARTLTVATPDGTRVERRVLDDEGGLTSIRPQQARRSGHLDLVISSRSSRLRSTCRPA
ncbi:hypothetical protein [Nonomuraea dietziae]|uniref:hypothetical protein n=1 Tax=Nonomuraea dietziae TaxID=65515 RepID=UPI003400C015